MWTLESPCLPAPMWPTSEDPSARALWLKWPMPHAVVTVAGTASSGTGTTCRRESLLGSTGTARSAKLRAIKHITRWRQATNLKKSELRMQSLMLNVDLWFWHRLDMEYGNKTWAYAVTFLYKSLLQEERFVPSFSTIQCTMYNVDTMYLKYCCFVGKSTLCVISHACWAALVDT